MSLRVSSLASSPSSFRRSSARLARPPFSRWFGTARVAPVLAALLVLAGPAGAAPSAQPNAAAAAEAPPPANAPAGEAPPSPAAVPSADPEGGLIALSRDLELVITEAGPDHPWTLHLQNRGSLSIGVMADPGLLWFEVAVPGRPNQVCRLPEPLWPKGMRRRSQVVLGPGERFSRRFDPRFFCFSDLVQTALVPEARVTPHFGWPVETRSKTVAGKRVTEPAPLSPPFVAWVAPQASSPDASSENGEDLEPGGGEADDGEGDSAAPAAAPAWQSPSEGLKNIVGGTLVLGPSYAEWSSRPPMPSEGLQVAMLAGSDAEDERGAVVTVGIGNAGAAPQTVLVRRDLISFEVTGPDGTFECPAGEIGPPDSASFSTLGSRDSQRLVIRLIEMCPRGEFSRPGLYEVTATWHSDHSGQSVGVDAFVGSVTSPRPALVRVRSGERSSFLRVAPMIGGGGTAGAAEAAASSPAEAPEDAPPAEEAPAEHEAPTDDAPPAEAPDGTLVE